MSESSSPTQVEKFTITLDADPTVHNKIAEATGIISKWYENSSQMGEINDVNSPEAIFVEAALSVDTEVNGLLIPKFKDHWPLAPVIVTCNGADADFLTEAMALGADDFIAKPIEASELINRLKIRRAALQKRAAKETIHVGDVTIDTLQRSVSSPRGQKFLSPTEIKLISELAKAGGNVVPREQLKSRCWPKQEVSDNALNRKLYEVRKRIKPITDSINIRTIYGVGFVLEDKRR